MLTHARKSVPFILASLGIAILAGTAAADPPKPSLPASAFKKATFKTAAKPALALSEPQLAKVQAVLKKARIEYAKDRNATRLMLAGDSLETEAQQAMYRHAAAASVSSSHVWRANGSRPQASVVPAYVIESGEVLSATTSTPCGGELQIAFTIRNRGVSLPAGKTARVFAVLVRSDNPSRTISSGWINLPKIDSGATTTIQLPSLQHRSTSNGSCPNGTIIVTPTFTEVNAAADYRLRIDLQPDGADATLVSGPFVSDAALECSASGGVRCPSGVCAPACPPCPAGMNESNGGCYDDLGIDLPRGGGIVAY